jgi:hypothetical protein
MLTQTISGASGASQAGSTVSSRLVTPSRWTKTLRMEEERQDAVSGRANADAAISRSTRRV